MKKKRKYRAQTSKWLGLTCLLFLIAAIRIYRLDAVDLRGDEAYSVVHWTATPFSETWLKLAKEEPHPAGAYTMYWAWNGVVGTSVFATRMMSVFGSILGGAITMTLARRLLRDWRLVALVGVLWMIHPFLIWHAQDARTYGVLSALTPLSFYWLLRSIEHRRGSQSLRVWLPYIIVQTLVIYTYYFEVFWLAAQGLYVLLLRRSDLLKQALKAWIVVGFLCIPVGLQLYWLLFVSDYQGTAESANFRELFDYFVPTLFFGENHTHLLLGVLFVVVFIGGLLIVTRRTGYMQPLLLLLWAMLPPILLYIASNFSSFFRPRYVTTVVPALILGIVVLVYFNVERFRHHNGIYVTSALVMVISFVSGLEVYDYFYNDPPKAPDWQGLATYLHDRTTPYDTVIFGQPDPAIEYYYHKKITFIPLEQIDLQPAFENILATNDAIFLLTGERTGAAGTFFQQHAQYIPGDTYQGVVQYRSWEVNPREIQHTLELQFGDVAWLRGYTLLQGEAGGTILLLYWEPIHTTETEHSILLHLTKTLEPPGEASPPSEAVLDHGIAGSLISTTFWQAGNLIRDPVPFPQDLASGIYWIRVGLYETGNVDHFIASRDEQYPNRYPIGQVTIR